MGGRRLRHGARAQGDPADPVSHLELPPIDVLDIPDDFEFMDPGLQEMLRLTLEPELVVLIDAREDGGY